MTADFRYLQDQNLWLRASPDDPCEILVGGTDQSPDRALLGLALRIAPMSATYHSQSQQYLAEFLDFARLDCSGPSSISLEGLEFTRGPEEFAVGLAIDGDLYGAWSVQFRLGNDAGQGEFHPVGFSRLQV